jgi:hypothetical protein
MLCCCQELADPHHQQVHGLHWLLIATLTSQLLFLSAGLVWCPSDDDIDQLLKELNIAPAAAAAAGSGSSGRPGGSGAGVSGSQPALLGIDPKKIRGDEELRRIFGAGVIEAVDRMEGELMYGGAVWCGDGSCKGAVCCVGRV